MKYYSDAMVSKNRIATSHSPWPSIWFELLVYSDEKLWFMIIIIFCFRMSKKNIFGKMTYSQRFSTSSNSELSEEDEGLAALIADIQVHWFNMIEILNELMCNILNLLLYLVMIQNKEIMNVFATALSLENFFWASKEPTSPVVYKNVFTWH